MLKFEGCDVFGELVFLCECGISFSLRQIKDAHRVCPGCKQEYWEFDLKKTINAAVRKEGA